MLSMRPIAPSKEATIQPKMPSILIHFPVDLTSRRLVESRNLLMSSRPVMEMTKVFDTLLYHDFQCNFIYIAHLTLFYAQRQCTEYGKLGLMGTTMLFSSGDFGVAGFRGVCLNPDGSESVNGTRFNRRFEVVPTPI